MNLIIVRHGETDHNVSGIVMGHAPIPLNKRGHEQAARVAQRLRDESIDVICSSDLSRAKSTAAAIAEHHPKVHMHITDAVRERSLGIYEGQHRDVLDPARHASGQPFHEWRPDQGESMVDLQQRAISWLHAMQQFHPHSTVLLVSHGGFIYALLTHIFHGQDFAFRPEYRHDNTGLTKILFDGSGQPTLVTLNDTSHLQGMEHLDQTVD